MKQPDIAKIQALIAQRGNGAVVRPKVLAELSGIAEKTLERYRSQGKGPPFIKQDGCVLYSLVVFLQWQEQRKTTKTPISSKSNDVVMARFARMIAAAIKGADPMQVIEAEKPRPVLARRLLCTLGHGYLYYLNAAAGFTVLHGGQPVRCRLQPSEIDALIARGVCRWETMAEAEARALVANMIG